MPPHDQEQAGTADQEDQRQEARIVAAGEADGQYGGQEDAEDVTEKCEKSLRQNATDPT